jgi:hypothetical protein
VLLAKSFCYAVGRVALGALDDSLCACVCRVCVLCSLQRNALVIGNGAYGGTYALRRAGACAEAVDARLTGLGFVTKVAKDCVHGDLKTVFDRFLATLSPGCTAVVYFAGHGWQEVETADCFLVPCDFSGSASGMQGSFDP